MLPALPGPLIGQWNAPIKMQAASNLPPPRPVGLWPITKI